MWLKAGVAEAKSVVAAAQIDIVPAFDVAVVVSAFVACLERAVGKTGMAEHSAPSHLGRALEGPYRTLVVDVSSAF